MTNTNEESGGQGPDTGKLETIWLLDLERLRDRLTLAQPHDGEEIQNVLEQVLYYLIEQEEKKAGIR